VRKYCVELIGTFFLVLTIGMTVINPKNAGDMAPLAIGSVLMVLVYAGGHISGAHYNPAVTLGVWLRGKCDLKDVPGYMIAQFLGGAGAAYLVLFLKVKPEITPGLPDPIPWLVVEFLFSFALVYIVLNVATSRATAGNSFYGLAIGFLVTAGAYAVGPISGAAFNPAVALGVLVMGLAPWSSLWIFLVANFAGGAVAALVFRALCPEEHRAELS
jgi:aquaporin Z